MKRLSFLLICMICCITTMADNWTDPETGYTWSYTVSDNGATIGENKWATGSLVIPTTINGYPVRSIGERAFQNCSGLTSITIPNSVTSIGSSAFELCSSLTSITIPNSVTSIGDWSFRGCSSLTSITIPNSVTSIGRSAFFGCSGLTSVTIPNSVTSIGYDAFYGCSSLSSITIPNSVTSIGSSAFELCSSLTSITIPNRVTSIGEWAFGDCSGLTSVTIPNSVTSIGESAFNRCGSLTSVTIGNSVTSIGFYAFSGCRSLTSVISKMENPCNIDNSCFSNIVFENTTLYVPQGTIDKYQATYGWNKFLHIEVNPQNEGITTDVNQIASVAVLIKANGGQLTIEGADDNTTVTAYTLEGVQLGSAVSRNGVATINTNVPAGSIAIVKVADKAVKVVMQ